MKRQLLAIALLAAACSGAAQTAADKAAGGDPLRGKTINVLGDSYVRNHRRPVGEAWHAVLAERHGMTYNNYGRNGGCVAFDRTREGFGPSMLVRCAEMDPEADVVLVIAGHNDAGKVGQSADSLRMFADSLECLIGRIRARCPRARVAWVTPWFVDGPGFRPVVKAIRRACRRNGVPVLDNYSARCVVRVRDADFRRRYFQGPNDTAHLNADGHALFLPVGEAFVRRVVE